MGHALSVFNLVAEKHRDTVLLNFLPFERRRTDSPGSCTAVLIGTRIINEDKIFAVLPY